MTRVADRSASRGSRCPPRRPDPRHSSPSRASLGSADRAYRDLLRLGKPQQQVFCLGLRCVGVFQRGWVWLRIAEFGTRLEHGKHLRAPTAQPCSAERSRTCSCSSLCPCARSPHRRARPPGKLPSRRQRASEPSPPGQRLTVGEPGSAVIIPTSRRRSPGHTAIPTPYPRNPNVGIEPPAASQRARDGHLGRVAAQWTADTPPLRPCESGSAPPMARAAAIATQPPATLTPSRQRPRKPNSAGPWRAVRAAAALPSRPSHPLSPHCGGPPNGGPVTALLSVKHLRELTSRPQPVRKVAPQPKQDLLLAIPDGGERRKQQQTRSRSQPRRQSKRRGIVRLPIRRLRAGLQGQRQS